MSDLVWLLPSCGCFAVAGLLCTAALLAVVADRAGWLR